MANIVDIQAAILLADGYLLELGDEMRLKQISGCSGCEVASLIEQIMYLEASLENKIYIGVYDDQTDNLYACLLGAIGDYSGSSVSVDPNASIPGIIIDVTIPVDNRPDPLVVEWSDMDESGDFGRTTYVNPEWAGFNPFLEVDNSPLLLLGNDYVLIESGGFILLPSGNPPSIYDGSLIRALNYASHTYFAPAITLQPITQSVAVGDPLVLTITASGADKYQWYMNGVGLTGETANTLNIASFSADDEGDYYCMAYTNGGSFINSQVAVISQAGTFAGKYIISNNKSSAAIQYNVNGAGNVSLAHGQSFEKDDYANGDDIVITLPIGSQIVATTLDGSGSPISTQTQQYPPTPTFANTNLQVTNGYTFVITDIIPKTLNNFSNLKSDGITPATGRSITLISAAGTTTLGVDFSASLYPYNTTINIKQAGVDSLVLKNGATLYPILGGNVDNIFTLADLASFFTIYNNN